MLYFLYFYDRISCMEIPDLQLILSFCLTFFHLCVIAGLKFTLEKKKIFFRLKIWSWKNETKNPIHWYASHILFISFIYLKNIFIYTNIRFFYFFLSTNKSFKQQKNSMKTFLFPFFLTEKNAFIWSSVPFLQAFIYQVKLGLKYLS